MNPLRKHALLPAAAALAAMAALLALAARQFAAASATRRDATTHAGQGAPAPVPGREPPPLVISRGMAECLAPGGAAAPGARERFLAEIRRRFRLAGFRIDPRRPEASRAIIEDRDARRQWLRRRGEELATAVTLAEVGTNSVVLSTPYGPHTLHLSRRGDAADGAPPAGNRGGSPAAGADSPSDGGAAARLAGHETSPGTWHFRRDDIMAYYDEIRHRPERLEAVFDTLAPIWFTDEADGRQKIEGYRVEPCGEEAFFAAVGFREGDVVREVNGIRMDNRFAAEDLIRRFTVGDLEFAHIRMERGGQEIVQSYFVE